MRTSAFPRDPDRVVPDLGPIARATLRSIVMIAVAMLLILVLLPRGARRRLNPATRAL